jgi:matrixin
MLRARGANFCAAAACAVSSVLGWTTSAAAFCRTMSCELGEKSSNPCPRADNQCVTKGHPLHWASSCLNYSVQVDGSPRSKLDADQVQAFVEQAFSAWKAAHCPGGGTPRFEVQFRSYVSCDRQEVDCDAPEKNANVVMFHDSGWLDGKERIGVTTPTGGKESGLVVDADIELNSQDYSFASDPSGMMSTSLLYVLTHELGHFLGLAHSQVAGSVMRPQNFQSLPFSPTLISPDDAAAICTAFPPGPKLSCNALPASTYDACTIPLGEHRSCQLASVTQDGMACACHLGASSHSPGAAAVAAFALCSTVLRRRRKQQPPSRAAVTSDL